MKQFTARELFKLTYPTANYDSLTAGYLAWWDKYAIQINAAISNGNADEQTDNHTGMYAESP